MVTAASKTVLADAPRPQRKPRVLLLEEDAVFAAHLRDGLSNIGCEVVLIRRGSEGLARAVTDRFDLMLVSAELPEVNGFRVCNRIKKDPNVSATLVFLMSADKRAMSEHERLATRADTYFDKPVSLDELSARVKQVLSARPERPTEAGLGVALDATRDQLVAFVELETRLTEQERTIANLTRELASARAAAVQAGATKAPPPVPSPVSRSGEHPAVRASLPSISSEIGADATADARRVARLEKQLAAAHADRDLSGKRARETAGRLEKVRAELATAREEWAAERAKLEKLSTASMQTSDAAARASASEREQLVAETTELRTRLATLEAAQKLARRTAEDRAAAATRAEAEAAELRAEVARVQREAAKDVEAASSELRELRTRLSKELVRGLDVAAEEMHRRATDEIAEVVARAGDLVRSTYAQVERVEKERDALLAERDADWKKRLETALAEQHAAHEAALAARAREHADERKSLEDAAAARIAAAEARVRTISAGHAAEIAAHEKSRADHAAERAQLAAKLDAVEALAASLREDIATLEREAETARSEVPQLEAEIVVLRGELMSVRRQLDLQELTVRAAAASRERDREIVERARRLLEELKSVDDLP